MRWVRLFVSGAALASLASLASTQSPAGDAAATSAASAPAAFGACTECHATTKGAAALEGPNLWNVGGRTAGINTDEDFPYSAAMKSSNITWNAENLTKYIMSPSQIVPGTEMNYRGQPDPAAAKAIADYLLTLKDPVTG